MTRFHLSSFRVATAAVLVAAGTLIPVDSARAAWPQGIANAEVVRTVIAQNGDVFVAGNFSGEASFGSITLHSAGLQDVFVARFDAGGRAVWAVSGGGSLTETLHGLTLDASSNAYIAGSLYGNAQFGGIVNNGASNNQDGFVAKVGAAGQWSWVRRISGPYSDVATDLVVLPGVATQIPPIPDTLLVTGGYADTVTFNAGVSKALTGNTIQDDFLAKLTTDGNEWLWATNRPGVGTYEVGRRLLLDDQSRLHMLGEEATAATAVVDDTFTPSSNLTNHWVVSANGGRAHIISQQHFDILRNSGAFPSNSSPGLGLNGGPVSVTTKDGIDASRSGSVSIHLKVRQGGAVGLPSGTGSISSGGYTYYNASEVPDASDEYLALEYQTRNGAWVELARYPGNPANSGGSVLYTFNKTVRDSGMFHDNLKLRVRQGGGSGPGFDWWFVERFAISISRNEGYLHSVSNLGVEDPVGLSWGSVVRFPGSSSIEDARLWGSGSTTRVGVVGSFSGNVSAPGTACGGNVSDPSGGGGFVAVLYEKFVNGASSYDCALLKATGGASARAISGTPTRAFIAGGFRNTMSLGSTSISGNPGSNDVYVAALDLGTQNWAWLTGGAVMAGNPPAPAGGLGDDVARAITVAPGGQLYVGGRFQDVAQFGPIDTLAAQGSSDGFVIKLGDDGRFFQPEVWRVGVPVTPPANAASADVASQPEFFLDGQPIAATGMDYRWFTWVKKPGAGYQLIPLQPTPQVEVHWRVQGAPPQDPARIVTLGAGAWPTSACGDNDVPGDNRPDGCYQTHVVGAPVEAKPSQYQIVGDVLLPASGSSGATLDAGIFNASHSGYAVITYVLGPSIDQNVYPTYVEVVRSSLYQLSPGFQSNVEVEIGKKITSTQHNEPNRAGWVINELAYYDGFGANAAYNRAARTGAIIPVNRYSSGRIQDAGRELAVAWYRRNGKGVYWASRAVRYSPRWPYNPDRIVIASEKGSEAFGQPLLTPTGFPQVQLYVQNDFSKPGFNPNDEHALMAPSSTGTGMDAVFALRSDFGGPDDAAAPSDPYVLLKYFNAANQEWNFKLYKVQATNPQYPSFRYTGTAGTTVSPPYPVRLLPGCAETFVSGQAHGEPPPPPFFQDHKNQLWAKSAGTGKVHYFYPMQPGFYQDNDNNDVSDYQVGQCTPWLARLPEDQGGAPSQFDPIPVEYSIVWPENPPLLIAGETLLKPKRGLPDIYNQAAVSIVYDDNRDTVPNAGPADTLAQLIDPLNPRWVRLAQLPGEIASEMRTDGLRTIIGSSDGTLKMPASLGERIYFDPQNGRLVFHGVFDQTGVGEPKLLLNVMSQRERVILKKLNGGDGTEASNFEGDCVASGACNWDEAVEALYRYSRNPNHVTRICRASVLDEHRQRVCTDLDTSISPDDDLLIAYRDPNNDGILQPINVVGGGAALTAGAATGSGYMTIAFNNDPALGALPVSLEVIKVGCLESSTSVPPIFAPYQGQINVIAPDNIFDEQLVLRHSGDFGGAPDKLQFEWYFHPDANGTPPLPLPDPATGQMHGWVQFPVANPNGAVEISIEGANIQTLSDNWYLARYRGLGVCGNTSNWSLWAGQPGATPIAPRAQLAEGWVKRVLARLNPFEARVQDFGQAATNNFASMLIQLGERYAGPIALNNDPNNLNSIGLIEAYTTVMRRAMQLSADATPPIDYGPANAAILLVASRLVDFYTLLGNEAYADAQDPTIGIDTEGTTINLNPSIFTFQNQLTSPLEEELTLLRGRDQSHGPVAASPVYNRLFWNFTRNNGEVAYALSYGITDQDANGVIDEYDARIMFPQGHGDAWGHYLTATTIYYTLLRHPFFSWNPQSEAVLVAGAPINVDYLDERQFAQTAVAKARAGAEIVDLTYRQAYTENPDGQWQGYDDSNPERAWGLSEWGRRAGMGAYFDWITVNAILPETDENPAHVGIQRIQRDNISELSEIAGYYASIQQQVDKADAGLNPLGLAKDVVPFDIDPQELTRYHKTQFEQIWDRAMKALNNAFALWDHANQLNNQLRRVQNSVDQQVTNSVQQETAFANQLIEIFGYPYVDDIGPGGTYPVGYNGPDIYHYMYVDVPQLAGTSLEVDANDLSVQKIQEVTGYFVPGRNGFGFFNVGPTTTLRDDVSADCAQIPMAEGCPLGDVDPDQLLAVDYVTIDSPDYGYWFTKPDTWTGSRRAPGKLQQILHQMFMARIDLKKSIDEYDKLRLDIVDQIDTVRTVFNTQLREMLVAQDQRRQLQALTATSQLMINGAIAARRVGEFLDFNFKTSAECIPKSLIAGFAVGGDPFSGPRCVVQAAGNVGKLVADTVADGLDIAGNAIDASKEDVTELSGLKSLLIDNNLEIYDVAGEIDSLLRQEPMLRAELNARTEAIKQLQGDYLATLAEGLRISDQLLTFRRTGAADVQQYRYKDMAFRIFRNDALQKYRASFDLAARYVYLAAAAYDYETNLLGSNSKAGQGFLTRIVKQRSLGQMLNGQPMAGPPGLADSMAQLAQNFAVLKGQMGFNNPQVETNRFSLRRELFRIPDGAEGDAQWQRKLEQARVPDLWQVPEFRRMARPFAPQSAGPQPGLVLEFSTNVTFGLNFFGWDLGPGDSSYMSSRFATRIFSVGTWFGNYANLPLADDPNVYLMPAGADVLRAPSATDFTVREWQVVDQAIPIPFPVGAQDIARYDWNPGDTLDESSVAIRRYPEMRAYHYSEPFDEAQVTSDSRLVGRSVWNRRWLLIIPGGTFLNNPNEGLDTFIHGARVPGGGGVRDGHGVDDIRIFFKTYSYTGN